MKSETVKVKNKNGIHMRPAVELVNKALQFASDITLETVLGKVNTKSILEVCMLGITNGTDVIITADGPDEYEAVAVIAEIVGRDFEKNSVKES